MNNGWYDAFIQEREYVSFSRNNSYFPLINDSIANSYLTEIKATCLPALKQCTSTTGEQMQCHDAQTACNTIDSKYAAYYPDVDPYDIRQPGSSPFPPETYVTYLSNPDILKKIGAKQNYTECSDAVDDRFYAYADCASPNLLSKLEGIS